MEEKIEAIKNWLGTGSINIFGLPMSGKDTVGVRLAEDLGARFLSSGMIIRAIEAEQRKEQRVTDTGQLIPQDVFFDWVLPYFEREDLKGSALVLSSVGRWDGEEREVLRTASGTGHPIMAVLLLNISEADVTERWEIVQKEGDAMRGQREDDRLREVFKTRIQEFEQKTMPVLQHYRQLGLLVTVNGDQDRETVYQEAIDAIYGLARGK